jgi:hypothetical protein
MRFEILIVPDIRITLSWDISLVGGYQCFILCVIKGRGISIRTMRELIPTGDSRKSSPVNGGKGTNVKKTTKDIYRCPRRNVPDFGRVFLMVKYTDITQNTYVQS